MGHHNLPAEVDSMSKEADPADEIGYAGKVSPALLVQSFQQCQNHLTDASSDYSDSASTDAGDTSSGNEHPLAVALPYLTIIAELRASLFPSKKGDAYTDCEMPPSQLVERYSSPSSVRTEHIQYAAQPATSSNTSLDPTSDGRADEFRPVIHILPCSLAKGGFKAVRFQDTADNLAAPSMDLSQAKWTLPLQVEAASTTKSRVLWAFHSVLDLRWSRRSRKNESAMPISTKESEQMRPKMSCKQAHATMGEEDQGNELLTKVPVKKGWAKKVARASRGRG